ncbi:MAG: hypothetical protein NTW86_23300 [Candidatus Sumerlaeota bacterium]|nr:hypothetical protein [Candidatus Sumerlaeota bacterium]
MAKVLIDNQRYERFSPSPVTGLGPGLSATLWLPVSKRFIPAVRALIDTGAETTWIYPRDVAIDLSSEVDSDSGTGRILVRVEIAGQTYSLRCTYRDHPYAGTEHMLIGMDLLQNWLVELNGRRRLLSVSHLDEGD